MNNNKKPIVKSYRGKQTIAQKLFITDAEKLMAKGYHPVSEKWEPGTWGCGSFLVALVLCIFLIGFLVFIYMLVVKPSGTLTVTYEFRNPQALASDEEKVCPKCAEKVKQAAIVCRFCGHDFT